MKRCSWLLASLCLYTVQGSAVELSQTMQAASARAVAQNTITQMIVKFHPQAISVNSFDPARSAAMIVNLRTGLQASVQRTMASGAYVMTLSKPITLFAADSYAASIAADPSVEYAEPDKLLFPMGEVIPNDPRYTEQWHYADPNAGYAAAINLPLAWGVTQGSSDVIVSVVDTGAINHADLKGNFLNGDVASSGRDFISQASIARDSNGRDSNPTDEGDWDSSSSSSWHGTHVAGTIAAHSNNSYGVAGVNWNAKLMTVRVLGAGGGYSSDIADGIMWSAGKTVGGVANPNPAQVINMSLGGTGKCSTTFQNAINYAVSQGTTMVVAAGNENKNISTSEPANCNNVIAVAALEKNGARASFSNYGTLVDVAAPGVSILSTLDSGKKTAANSNTYALYAGTSMATPHVSGVVSLMYGVNKNLRDGTIAKANVPALIESKLKTAVRAFPTDTARNCTTVNCGAGMLDAYQAVLAVSTPPTVDAGNDGVTAAGLTVNLQATAADDAFDGKIVAYQWTQIAGEHVELTNATTASPRFIAPLNAGQLQFRVTVTDDTGWTAFDDVSITVTEEDGSSVLVVSKSGTGQGVVSSEPAGIDCGTDCSETYMTDTQVTLSATPDSNSVFSGWSGACGGSDTTCTVSVDVSKTVAATFTSIVNPTVTLTVSKMGTGGGTVSSVPTGINCGTDCSEDYTVDTDVTLTATPASDASFTGWTGACSGTATTCSVRMSEAQTVTATFTTLKQYRLQVVIGGFGDGKVTSNPTGIQCDLWGNKCSAKFTAGTSVTLTAAPTPDSRFVKWTGACTGTNPVCVVSVNAAKNATATFRYKF